jgi:hypothetical protein
MNSNLKSVLNALGGTTVLMLIMWVLYSSIQPRGEYKEVVTFNSQSEYNAWCKVNDTYVPFLHWNWFHNSNAQVTLWSREDWWGNLHYTDTGKNVSGVGCLTDDNDKTD